ncbi:UNVERIFIED_CONTAM: hypothetical protein FKN15_052743 [Acipenser sinensis]
MLELKTLLEVALKNRHEMHAAPPPQYYTQLIKEIESLGWDKLAYIDTEFSTIKLKAEDTSGREHLITVKLKSKSSLINIHNQFLAALESLKEFWDVMDEIDKMTWVLEPEKPTRSATMRRIAIGEDRKLIGTAGDRRSSTLTQQQQLSQYCALLGDSCPESADP